MSTTSVVRHVIVLAFFVTLVIFYVKSVEKPPHRHKEHRMSYVSNFEGRSDD